MFEEIYNEVREKMDKSIDALDNEMQRVRTGRASMTLLDGVRVDYYGNLTPLSQMATVSVADPKSITIKPWDVSMIKEIEKAILKANLGLTPSNDGKLVRVPVPSLTEDSRKEIVKNTNKICENYRVTIRNIRRDINEKIKTMQKNKEVSEDESFKIQDEVQKITTSYIKKIDTIYTEKEKEILAI